MENIRSVLPLQLDSDVVYLLKVPGVFNERPRPLVVFVYKSASHSCKRFAQEAFSRRPQILAACTWSIKSALYKRSWV